MKNNTAILATDLRSELNWMILEIAKFDEYVFGDCGTCSRK